MSTRPALPVNRSMPPHGVIPVLLYPAVADAAAWLCRAFGFSERLRIGTHRIQLDTDGGCGAIVVAEAPTAARPAGVSVMVRIADVDAHHAAARAAGAEILRAPESHVYGERQYSCVDFAGHVWTFTQTLADVAPEDWGGGRVGEGGAGN